MKLTQVVEGFLLEKRIESSGATVKKYAYVFRRLVAHSGDVEFATITPTDVRKFLESLRTQHEQDEKRRKPVNDSHHASQAKYNLSTVEYFDKRLSIACNRHSSTVLTLTRVRRLGNIPINVGQNQIICAPSG